jgi:hypothetical protein
MILQEYLCALRDAIIERGMVNTFYPYCEQIERDGITFPAQYISGGEYKQVQDFDVNGNGYIRKRGSVSVALNRSSSFTACEDDNAIVNLTYPLRMVLGVPKANLRDDAYSDDLLMFEMFEIIGTTYNVTNVQDVSNQVRSFDTDSLTIWSQEVRGFDYQMHFRLSYIAVDFDVTFTVSKSCLKEQCNGY